MEAWQRRYKERRQEAYERYYNKLIKINRPDCVRLNTFTEVVEKTAKKLADKYMTSLRTGERNV